VHGRHPLNPVHRMARPEGSVRPDFPVRVLAAYEQSRCRDGPLKVIAHNRRCIEAKLSDVARQIAWSFVAIDLKNLLHARIVEEDMTGKLYCFAVGEGVEETEGFD